jgi:hypothetical protein
MRRKRKVEVKHDDFTGENIATIHLDTMLVAAGGPREFKIFPLVSRSSKHEDSIFLFHRWKSNGLELYSIQGGSNQETILDQRDVHNEHEQLKSWLECTYGGIELQSSLLQRIRSNGGLDCIMIFAPPGDCTDPTQLITHSFRLDPEFLKAVDQLLDFAG